jgi:hypothetical protein
MIALTGDHKTLYDVLQSKAKADLERAAGAEIAALPDNDTLARDIGNLSLATVADLIRRHSSPGRVW